MPTLLLPSQASPRLLQATGPVTAATLAKTEHLIVIVPETQKASLWKAFPGGTQVKALRNQRNNHSATTIRLQNSAHTGITVDSLKGSANGGQLPSMFALLTCAGRIAKAALADNPASVTVFACGFTDDAGETVSKALVLALSAHSFALPDYRSKKRPLARLKSIRVAGLPKRIDLNRAQAEARATNLARWLTAQPPNQLDTPNYRHTIETMAKQNGWSAEFLNEKKLKKLGAGAFLAVSQGNPSRDAGIMHLRYRPPGEGKRSQPAVSLVGKGIIFDTGGTNLKPFKSMLDMHHDMAGSAVALGTLAALTELEAPFAVDCWLAITENRLSNDAYKSRDIVTACNGTTIEIVHTDAEGRMVLADTLALAGRDEPSTIIDFATLTGTCVAAVTERYSGAFTNRSELNASIIEAGQQSGERVWPFPMDADFDEDIKSHVADVLQCAPGGGGDHIQAARFLNRFVPDACAWIHVDLSAASRKAGLAQVPGEVTGFGVRFAMRLLLDHFDQLKAAAARDPNA